jgi:hypothetical protein
MSSEDKIGVIFNPTKLLVTFKKFGVLETPK